MAAGSASQPTVNVESWKRATLTMTETSVTPRDFKARQQYYEHHPLYKHRQDSWMKCYDYIVSALKLIQPTTVVELGANDGSLAIECLGNLPRYVQWIGYDIHSRFIEQSKTHPRYKPVAAPVQNVVSMQSPMIWS